MFKKLFMLLNDSSILLVSFEPLPLFAIFEALSEGAEPRKVHVRGPRDYPLLSDRLPSDLAQQALPSARLLIELKYANLSVGFSPAHQLRRYR